MWGEGVARVHPHMHWQSYTPMSLKQHACTPTKHMSAFKRPQKQTWTQLSLFSPAPTHVFAHTNTSKCAYAHRQTKLRNTRKGIGHKSLCTKQKSTLVKRVVQASCRLATSACLPSTLLANQEAASLLEALATCCLQKATQAVLLLHPGPL